MVVLWTCRRDVLRATEDADYPVTVPEGYRADAHGTRLPPIETRWPVASVSGEVPSTFLGEQLTSAATVLGRDDRGEVTTANIAEKLLDCRIDPSDNACLVEDIARDADVLQSLAVSLIEARRRTRRAGAGGEPPRGKADRVSACRPHDPTRRHCARDPLGGESLSRS